MKTWILWGLLCLTSHLQAQLAPDKSGDDYLKLLAEELLLNGKEYRHYYMLTDGKQFLTKQSLLVGNLSYDGVDYENLELNYDIYNQILFFAFFLGNERCYLILNEKKISRFSLAGLNFIYLRDSTWQGLKAGFYEEAFAGERDVLLVRYHKNLIKDINTMNGTQQKFEPKTTYYLVRNDSVHPIKNKKDVLAAFGDSPELIRYLKQEKIRLRKKRPDFKANLRKIVEFMKG